MAVPLLATLTDVKAHLNKASTVDDNELQSMVDAASEVVVAYIGVGFGSEAVTERVDVRAGTVLLSRRPVSGDVALVDVTGGVVTGHTVNSAAGVVYDVVAYGPLTATYTAGDPAVPASVTLATAIIAAHLYETQRVPGARAPGVGGTAAFTEQQWVTPPPAGFAIPNRARELLERYRRAAIA